MLIANASKRVTWRLPKYEDQTTRGHAVSLEAYQGEVHGEEMTIQKVVCDECGRVKAEANHWHQLMVWIGSGGALALAAGMLSDQLALERVTPPVKPEVHDLCGEQCLHKHLAKLLGFNPANDQVTADHSTAEAK